MINQRIKSPRRIFVKILSSLLILIATFFCQHHISAQEIANQNRIHAIVDNSLVNVLSYQADEIPTLQKILENAELISVMNNCNCKGVVLIWAQKHSDAIRVVNPGFKFNEDSKRLLSKAQEGDKYMLDNIKLDCGTGIEPAGQVLISIVE